MKIAFLGTYDEYLRWCEANPETSGKRYMSHYPNVVHVTGMPSVRGRVFDSMVTVSTSYLRDRAEAVVEETQSALRLVRV